MAVIGCALLMTGCASYDNTACNNAFSAAQNAINNKNYDTYLNNRQTMMQLCYSSNTDYKVTSQVMDYDTNLFKQWYANKDYENLIKFTDQDFANSNPKRYFPHLLMQYQYYDGLAKQQAKSNPAQALSTISSFETQITRYARELGVAYANYLYADAYKTRSETGDRSKALLEKFVTALNLTPLANGDMYTAAMNLARDNKNAKIASRLNSQWTALNSAWGSVNEANRLMPQSGKLSEVAAVLKKKGFTQLAETTGALAGSRHNTEISNQQYAAQQAQAQAQADAERAQAAQQEAQQPSQVDTLVNAVTGVASSAIIAHASGGSVSQAVGNSLNQAALAANSSSESSYSPSASSGAGASSAGSSGGGSGGARPALSAEAMAIDLSGDCDTAERKGTQAAERIGAQAQSSDAGICSSGKGAKLLGEITVRVAQACKVRPTWQQLEDQGYDMINQAQQTIDGSCSP